MLIVSSLLQWEKNHQLKESFEENMGKKRVKDKKIYNRIMAMFSRAGYLMISEGTPKQWRDK